MIIGRETFGHTEHLHSIEIYAALCEPEEASRLVEEALHIKQLCQIEETKILRQRSLHKQPSAADQDTVYSKLKRCLFERVGILPFIVLVFAFVLRSVFVRDDNSPKHCM